MSRIFHPLLYILVSATRQELARQVHYLKTENQILRSKLPKRVLVTPGERQQLVKAGRGVGQPIKDLVAIVQPATFLRWMNADTTPKSNKTHSTRKPGRPRTPEDVRQLIVRIATETGWGYTRVLGELRKLGYRLSRQTVKNILIEHGIDPGPKRGKGTWDEFINIHASTMWACDFLSKRVWTLRGPIDLYLLVFLQIGSRKAWVSTATAHPDSAWVAQQSRNFCMDLPDGDRKRALVLHDSDTKFTEQFRGILKAEGLRPKKLIPVSPNLNAYVERFIQTIQQECLDHFVVVGKPHLDYVVREFLRYYHEERPHQGLGNVPPIIPLTPIECQGDVVCHERLGGLLKIYRRAA
jgi:putative transposase